MLRLQFLIMCIGLIVFFLQNKVRYSSTEVSQKIVYWTVLFFISLSFNTILFTTYGQWYNVGTYLNINTFLIMLLIVLGCLFIQLLSPFKHFKNFIKKFNKKKTTGSVEPIKIITSEESKYMRQAHFEIFLETICWIGFISIFAIQSYISIFGDSSIVGFIESNFILVLCLLIMLTLPITIRQILFYLTNIRSLKATTLSDEELHLQQKLKKNNYKL